MDTTTEGIESDLQVVVNDEDQHSVWPVGRELPDGWRAEGTTGSRQDCLAHIDRVWTDLRPRSLRDQALVDHR